MQGVVVPLNEAAVIVLVPKRGALGEVPRERSPPPGLRLLQAELSRKSNQVARRRIRRFESDMPSQAVVSNSGGCLESGDIRADPSIAREILEFIENHGA